MTAAAALRELSCHEEDPPAVACMGNRAGSLGLAHRRLTLLIAFPYRLSQNTPGPDAMGPAERNPTRSSGGNGSKGGGGPREREPAAANGNLQRPSGTTQPGVGF